VNRRYFIDGLLFGIDIIFSVVFLNTTRRIQQFLLSCIKGMAGRTDFNPHISHGATGFYHISTGAGNRAGFIFGVNFISHENPLYLFIKPSMLQMTSEKNKLYLSTKQPGKRTHLQCEATRIKTLLKKRNLFVYKQITCSLTGIPLENIAVFFLPCNFCLTYTMDIFLNYHLNKCSITK
jgi:hypothetical protein